MAVALAATSEGQPAPEAAQAAEEAAEDEVAGHPTYRATRTRNPFHRKAIPMDRTIPQTTDNRTGDSGYVGRHRDPRARLALRLGFYRPRHAAPIQPSDADTARADR